MPMAVPVQGGQTLDSDIPAPASTGHAPPTTSKAPVKNDASVPMNLMFGPSSNGADSAEVQQWCHAHGATKPLKDEQNPQALTPSQESRTVAIRFKSTSKVWVSLDVKGGCGHNFMFTGKVCISGQCDPCGTPISCLFLQWQDWGECTKTCGGGEASRAREVRRIPRARSTHSDAGCSGALAQAKTCNIFSCDQDCRPVDCQWESWRPWSACGKCGGQKTRSRKIKQLNHCGGVRCKATNAEETAKCPRRCEGGEPQYCVWGDWTAFGACSKTCGGGRKSRKRELKQTSEAPAQPEPERMLQEKFTRYNQLLERVQRVEVRRVKTMLLSFITGCCSLIAMLAATRACSRVTQARSARSRAYYLSEE